MSKKFTYTKITGHYFCMASDDWEQDGVEFDYEVEDKELLPEIVDLVFEDYFEGVGDTKATKEAIKKMLNENDLVEVFADLYEDTLKEIFQDEALDAYED